MNTVSSAASGVALSALAALQASANVIVGGDMPIDDLIHLAEVAASWGASLTVRESRTIASADLKRIAQAGRGHVTFDFT